ncbi:MAG: hypothetical protein ACREXU_06775 [Gammaproteobacteria bacterium]
MDALDGGTVVVVVPLWFEALILPSGSGLIAGLGCASSGRAVVADADPGEDAFLAACRT